MIAVHNLYFLPPAASFSSFMHAEEILFEACEHYQKRSYRNRYAINTSQGKLLLSIPLAKGKNEHCPVRDVRIAYDEDWTKNHLHTIRTAYGKTPYFEHYFSAFEALLNRKEQFLFDLQHAAIEWSFKMLRLNIPYHFTQSYVVAYPSDVADNRTQSKHTDHQPDQTTSPSYPQPWQEKHGFVDGLSILDTLFCCGPETMLYLQPYKINLEAQS